jgi:carbonic anhydrase
MKKVIDGVARFKNEVYPKHKELFEKLSSGQSPEVLFITCADSRIDANLITQTNPGDLFHVRNAGNIVPPHGPGAGGTVASIEFAVGALGTTEIVVCGHTDCGAMKGALAPEGLTEFPHVCDWLKHSEAASRIVKDNHGDLDGADRLNLMIEQNVVAQLQNLRTHPFVASKLAAGKVRLHGWVYDIKSGVINVYDEGTGEFSPLEDDAVYTSIAAE